jgi:hypothetical protein
MARVIEQGRGMFEVVIHERRRSWFGGEGPAPPPMDPATVGAALVAVLDSCRERAVDGRLIFWNEFRVFLNTAEFLHLRPMVDLTVGGLDQLVDERVRERNAVQVGRTVIRLGVDRDEDVPAGTLRVRCERVRDPDIGGDREGEVTIRAGRDVKRPNVEHGTHGVADHGPFRLEWPGHSVNLRAGTKVFLGRPHPEAAEPFVALVGADARINSRHVSLEVTPVVVVLQRLPEANPVAVNGGAVQPGGKVEISAFPATVTLSHVFSVQVVKV